MTNENDLSAWRLFLKIAETGSISQAASLLDMDASTASRKLNRLERDLGFPLFIRSTRTVTLTAEGKKAFQKIGHAIRGLDSSLTELRTHSESAFSDITLCGPGCVVEHLITPWAAEFCALHPCVRFHFVIKDAAVDPHLSGIDMAIQCGATAIGSEQTRFIGHFCRRMVASPTYLREAGSPQRPEDLYEHFLMDYDGQMADSLMFFKDGKKFRPDRDRVMISSSSTGPVMRLTLQGKGILLTIPEFMCHEELERGDLVPVLPDWTQANKAVHVMLSRQASRNPKVTAFVEFMKSQWLSVPGLVA